MGCKCGSPLAWACNVNKKFMYSELAVIPNMLTLVSVGAGNGWAAILGSLFPRHAVSKCILRVRGDDEFSICLCPGCSGYLQQVEADFVY